MNTADHLAAPVIGASESGRKPSRPSSEARSAHNIQRLISGRECLSTAPPAAVENRRQMYCTAFQDVRQAVGVHDADSVVVGDDDVAGPNKVAASSTGSPIDSVAYRYRAARGARPREHTGRPVSRMDAVPRTAPETNRRFRPRRPSAPNRAHHSGIRRQTIDDDVPAVRARVQIAVAEARAQAQIRSLFSARERVSRR